MVEQKLFSSIYNYDLSTIVSNTKNSIDNNNFSSINKSSDILKWLYFLSDSVFGSVWYNGGSMSYADS